MLAIVLAGCTISVTPGPLLSQPGSAAPEQSAGPAVEVCASDPFGCVEVATGDPILIGTALALTGPHAALGLDSQYGAQVALNLRGPVRGHEVELVNHDDRCSPDGGTAAASLLAELPGMVGVIGTSCSAAAAPASDILGEQGILLISPSNTAPRLTEGDARPFYARTAPNDVLQARAMAQFACAEASVSTAATLHDGGPYALALQEAFAAAFAAECDGTMTAQVAITADGPTLAAGLSDIATSNDGASPELLYVPTVGEGSTQMTGRARRTSGMEDTILAGLQLGEDGTATSELFDGTFLSAPTLMPTGAFYTGAFLEEYRNVSALDDPIAAFHGHAYDAVNLLLDAVAEAAVEEDGTLYVPRTALRDLVLATQGYEGLAGTYTCQRSGDCGAPTITVSLVEDRSLAPIWP